MVGNKNNTILKNKLLFSNKFRNICVNENEF